MKVSRETKTRVRHPHGEESDRPVPVGLHDVLGDRAAINRAILVQLEVLQLLIAKTETHHVAVFSEEQHRALCHPLYSLSVLPSSFTQLLCDGLFASTDRVPPHKRGIDRMENPKRE